MQKKEMIMRINVNIINKMEDKCMNPFGNISTIRD
jgi:hypothetical protein